MNPEADIRHEAQADPASSADAVATPRAVVSDSKCRCNHAHSEHAKEHAGMCVAPKCSCLVFRAAPAVATQSEALKRCPHCEQKKPHVEFYKEPAKFDGLSGWCKRCQSDRPKPVTSTSLIRQRARHRAIAELIKEHDHEFRGLLERFKVECIQEAGALQSEPAAAHYGSQTVRLRPGRRLPGETVTDRIDVARCPDCIGYHDRGHVCESCGAEPTPDVAHTHSARVRIS